MKKVAITNKIRRMEETSRLILEEIFLESIVDISNKDFICKNMLERIVLIYLSLFGERKYIEMEDLTKYELKIICKIISKGICSIYINEKYLTPVIRYKKMLIIDELIDFMHIITNLEIDTLRILIIKDMNKFIQKKFFGELV